MGEIEGVAGLSNRVVKNMLPSERYHSTVGVYGGKISINPYGKMIYTINHGLVNRIDVIGDQILRKMDDHAMKHPLRMFFHHPKDFFYSAFKSDSVRQRGTPKQIAENIKRLGLSDYYGVTDKGIEIKKPEVFTQGIAIKDIFRSDLINSPVLSDIDRFQALEEEVKYIKSVHDKYGPAVDFIDDVMFQKKDGIKVLEPVLNIPDIALTPSEKRLEQIKARLTLQAKRTKANKSGFARELNLDVKKVELGYSETHAIDKKVKERILREQKATDVVELLVWTAFEEFRRSNDASSVGKAMKTIIDNYNDKVILGIVRSFIKRGRPTLPGEKMDKGATAWNNKVHLSATKRRSAEVREIIGKKLTEYFALPKPSPEPNKV
jgi:hypothetical protein